MDVTVKHDGTFFRLVDPNTKKVIEDENGPVDKGGFGRRRQAFAAAQRLHDGATVTAKEGVTVASKPKKKAAKKPAKKKAKKAAKKKVAKKKAAKKKSKKKAKKKK